jgi:hypothetical protein
VELLDSTIGKLKEKLEPFQKSDKRAVG